MRLVSAAVVTHATEQGAEDLVSLEVGLKREVPPSVFRSRYASR